MPRSNLTPIDIEYKGYHAVSSGSFSIGMGSCYIIRPDGRLSCHMTLDVKPTEKLLTEILHNFVNAQEQGGEDGKQEEKSNPSNNG